MTQQMTSGGFHLSLQGRVSLCLCWRQPLLALTLQSPGHRAVPVLCLPGVGAWLVQGVFCPQRVTFLLLPSERAAAASTQSGLFLKPDVSRQPGKGGV